VSDFAVPTVGRIVHAQEDGDAPCLAAIVVQANDDLTLELAVFTAGSLDGRSNETADVDIPWPIRWSGVDLRPLRVEEAGQRCWHWPERQP
jgi:hypothetical protein